MHRKRAILWIIGSRRSAKKIGVEPRACAWADVFGGQTHKDDLLSVPLSTITHAESVLTCPFVATAPAGAR
jgi:hypothetical protein